MPRRLFNQITHRLQPAVTRITSHPWVRRWLPSLADPDLWHLNRRSAARAVALGLFCGLIPGPLQALAAILMCLVLRAHFPVAIVTTFYTNPFTIVPLYVAAYELGRPFFADTAPAATFALAPTAGLFDVLPAMGQWMIGMGKPLALGLVLLALLLSTTGWIVVRIAWRCHAVWAWRRRSRLRAAA